MNLKRLIWNAPCLSDRRKVEWYPPFWLMRIQVRELSEGWRKIRIRLPSTWISRNAGGGLFGGFQAALADPIAAMACAHVFPGYSVWTRSLHLDFRHEGRGDLELRFDFSADQEAIIRGEIESRGRSTPRFEYGFYSEEGRLCTAVHAGIAIRPKGYKKPVRDGE